MSSCFRCGVLLLAALVLAQCTLVPAAPQATEPTTQLAGAQAATLVAATATPVPTVAPTAVPTATLLPTVVPTPTPAPVPALSERFEPQPGDRVRQLTPGVVHIQRNTADPLKINILLFDITAPEFNLKTAIGDGWLSGRYRTSQLALEHNALAAINGDLFADGGIPQGLTVVDGAVAMAPKYRATFGWSKQREPFIGYFTNQWTWQAEVTAPNGENRPIPFLNTSCALGEVCLFNEFARSVPALQGDVKVVLDSANRVTDVIQSLRTRVLTDTQVLRGTGAGARWLLNNLSVGDQVGLSIVTDPPLEDYAQGISGGPIILRDGQFVQDCLCALGDCSATDEEGLFCEDFTTEWKLSHYLWTRMPRTGIGYDEQKQTLIVAVVDGYQRGYSRGVTQEEFADLLREFGAHTAMELDGGGSSTMVINDRVVNQPPDDTGERYVANALLFFWNDLRVTRDVVVD